MFTSMHPIPPGQQGAYTQAALGAFLPSNLEMVHNQSYAAERMRFTGTNLRENASMQAGGYNLFNPYENAQSTCQTASVQGGRPSLFWSQTSSGSHCPAPVSINGMLQTPTAVDLINASTQARQSRERFVDNDPFVSLVPNDGSFGTRLLGAPFAGDVGCDTHFGNISSKTSACSVGSNPFLGGSASGADFFATDGVSGNERAVANYQIDGM